MRRAHAQITGRREGLNLPYGPASIFLLLAATLLAAQPVFCADSWDAEVKRQYQNGNFYFEQKDFQEAQKHYQRALGIIADAGGAHGRAPLSAQQKTAAPRAQDQKKESADAGRAESSARKEYLIGPDDTLAVSVWQNPDLSQDIVVRPDGKISFPLIGDVDALGFTLTQLDATITERLKEYIRAPEVSVTMRKFGGQRVLIFGEVRSVGVHSVTGSQTILEAIALAGGFSRDAVPSSVILIRGGFEHPYAQRINLSKALKAVPRQNIQVQSGDIIFVPRKFIADISYFMGQVLDPLSKGLYTARELQTYGVGGK